MLNVQVAYSMIADHGMGKSAPNLSFHEARSQRRRVNLWSDKLQHEMDEEVNSIVQVLLCQLQAIFVYYLLTMFINYKTLGGRNLAPSEVTGGGQFLTDCYKYNWLQSVSLLSIITHA